MKTPSQSLFAALKKCFLPLLAAFFTMTGTPAQAATTNNVLILYDSGTNTPNASVGWIGNLHATFLANLLGHFDLNYTIEPVENYQSGQISNSYATFYLGLIYNNPLPAAFTNDVTTATNPVCWFKYNMWQVSGNIYFPQPLDSQIGFRFLGLDETGFTNILYKNIMLLKNPADPEMGVAGIINSNIARVVATAWETNGGVATNVPYITHGSNFWYVGDSPFDYMGEQDRYLAFCDVLHDILNINAPEAHMAIIRLEDVTMDVYDPVTDLTPCVDYLHTNNVPFCMATIPYYTDPLGYYNSGIPESHRISDATDPTSVQMLQALEHATNSGGQIIIHGYTHQYSDVVNPYTGVSADDFEFWRETLTNQYVTNGPIITTNVVTGQYTPIPGDSTAWAYSRIQGATNEFTQAGLKWIGWETVHYTASAPDYQVFATNFNLTMQRVIYFANDYDSVTNPTHEGGQLFPYVIDRDVYGQKVVGETCGNYEESDFENYPAHSVTDILNAAHCALVVRDGWGNAFYHGFYGVSNLQQIVTGIQALGYKYVPIVPTGAPVITFPPLSQTNVPAGTNIFLGVTAIGSQPLSYQWWLNATNSVSGATNNLLNFPGAQPASSGNYTVIVSNSFGSVTSSIAVLNIGLGPIITNGPAAQTNVIGGTATFTVTAGGTAPLAYQWLFNDTNLLAGATNTSLVITNAQTNNIGNYSVIVSNGFNSVTSTDALLTLHLPPVITNQPASQFAVQNSSVTFTVGAYGDPTLAYQWYFEVTNKINAATSPSYTITSAKISNDGAFTVVITNNYGVTTSAPAILTVASSPIITNQPASQTVSAGQNATFNVGAIGVAPLTYQWWLNATNSLGGATNASLTVTNVQSTNLGNYTVIVGNTYGSVTSSIAVLNFHQPPVVTNPPASLAIVVSNTAAFSVGASGDQPLSYQWWFNATNSLGGATNATLVISNAPATAAGSYAVVITNLYGGTTSTPAILTIYTSPVITNPPVAQSVVLSNTAAFTVGATGANPLSYQWWFNATNQLNGAILPTLSISNAQPANAGNYTVVVGNTYGSVTSAPVALTVNIPPFITNQPAAQQVNISSNATFTVGAGGDAPLVYQWFFNATNLLAGATNSTFILTNAQSTNVGNYSVIITNNYGAVTSTPATLALFTAPVITVPPVAQSVVLSNTAAFTVGATGSQPLVYQWWFNVTNQIGGATNATLSITNVQGANAGNYSVIVTNTFGSATSVPVALTIDFPPVITNPPVAQTVVLSNSATFTVGASGSPTLTYQWWFNVTNLLGGATGTSLTISNAQSANAGVYSVVVTNNYGMATSAPVALTVQIPPFITNQPAAQAVIASSNATFTVGAGGDQPLSYQWWFNATNILTGATNSTFVLTNAQTTNIGGYSVIITNDAGSVTSTVAPLSVGNPVVITNDLVSQSVVLSNSASFTIGVTGDPTLTYQWWFNVTNLLGSVTGPTLTIPVALPGNAGGYSVVVSNPYNSVTSSVATLTVQIPAFITNQPAGQTAGLSSNATFIVGAGGDQPLSYQWWFDTTNILTGATNSTLIITNVQSTNVGGYNVVITNDVGSVTSTVAALAIGRPTTITNDLTNETVVLSNTASFSIGASGNAPLSYQWWFNVTNQINGATNGAFIITNAQAASAGSYSVIVSNPFGTATSSVVALTVLIPPVITNQPVAQSVILSNTATFTVGASGDQPLGYQWWFNTTNILTGATNSALVLTNVQTANAGSYSVIITNDAGVVTSAVVALTVDLPPSITAGPTNQTVATNKIATFTVAAIGTGTLHYQWQFNNTNILNATSTTYTIASVKTTNAGNYTVVVTNLYGITTSTPPAVLTVVTPPYIITEPQASATVATNTTTNFTVVAGGTATLAYQWLFDNTNILNATNATLTLSNIVETNMGSYTVVVTNNYGSVTSSVAALTVDGPPLITVQPTNAYAIDFANVTFSVTALGVPTLGYQWQSGGKNINGSSGRNSTYSVTAFNNSGTTYDVIINNSYGSVTSAVVTLSIGTAPAITTQPTNRTVSAGGNTTFTVVASGTATLGYQWRFNTTNNIPNATSSTFTIDGLVATNAGNYTVVVTNNYGAVTSSVAALTINGPPFITTQPTNQTVLVGSNATFTVAAAGNAPLRYQWWFNATNLLNNATNTLLTLTNSALTNAGNYTVIITNTYGSVTSSVAALTVTVPATPPFITNQPAAQAVAIGNNATFTVGAGGDAPLTYQWWFNATNILAGATSNIFVLTNAQTTNIGAYSVIITNNSGSITSAPAALTVGNPVVITNDLVPQSVLLSNSASFTIGVSGDAPLTYHWWFNVTNLLGSATGPTLTIPSVLPGNVGSYSVVVSNPYNSATSSVVALTVNTPPFITNQPAAQAAAIGSNATFTVGAGGDAPLTYQWWFNSTNLLSGATNNNFVLTNAQTTNIGAYSVIITNNSGSVTSTPAALIVGNPVVITNDLAPQSVVVSNSASFTIGVTGDPTLTYQWWFNVTNLLGSVTGPTLTIPSVLPGNAGSYSVVVSNPYNSVTSSVVTLTVQTPPFITNQPAAQSVVAGNNATFTVGAGGNAPLTYQWWFNATNILNGATNSTFILTNAQSTNVGGYSVIITNNSGSVTSAPAALTVGNPVVITNDLTSQSVILSNTASFTIGVSGDAPLSYHWRFNITNLLGSVTGPTLTIPNAQPANAGSYSVVVSNLYNAVTSSIVSLTVHIPPFITNQPVGQTVVASNNASFTVGAGGDAPLSYQWWFNATNILAGATNSTLIITNAQSTNVGGYSVIVANNSGSVTSTPAALTVGNPVVITNNLTPESVVLSNTAAFTIGVSGDAPLSYHWWFNVTNQIGGATNATLLIPNAQPGNAGGYSVVVGNPYNTVTSSVAALSVLIPAFITNPPASQSVNVGSNVTFTVGAGGDQPLSYQWWFNATNQLNGSTNMILLLSNVPTNAAGNYTVVVTNDAGSVTSSVAALTVTVPAPTVTNAPVILAGGVPLQLSFPTQTGFTYYIEYVNALGGGSWQQLTNLPGTGGPVSVTVTMPTASRFYRVRVQ